MDDSAAIPTPTPGAEIPVPRDSATVILVRDSAGGPEIFMLERHIQSDFVGGAYVFPGGKIDEADSDPALHAFVDGLDAAEAASMVEATPDGAFSFHLAAIRETFEESGALIARHAGGDIVRLDGAEHERFAAARRALIAGEATLIDLAKQENIRYALDLMAYVARWVTPEGMHRRYDARFFLSTLPQGQSPVHDDVETTASLWVRPEDALAKARAGELSIIFPTRKMLERLSGHADVDALAVAMTRDPVLTIIPKLVLHEGTPRVLLPGDDTLHEA